MALQLEGGLNRQIVDAIDNHLKVTARQEPRIAQESRDNGQSCSWSSGTYDYDAADTVLLIKNTSETQKLYVHSVSMSGDTDTRVVVHCPTTEVASPTGTAITGSNLNRVSNNVAPATAIRDETTNAQGDIIWAGEIHAATNATVLTYSGMLVIGTNQSIGVDYVTDGTACDVTIMGYYN